MGSGTLSYIFNNFKGTRSFSEVVSEAKQAGYTEPDPRDDLSGTDVARKVIHRCMRRRCVSILASTICLKQRRRGHLISKLSLKFPDKQRGGGGGIGLTFQPFFLRKLVLKS